MCSRPTDFSYSKGSYIGFYEFLANVDWSVITSPEVDVISQVSISTDTVTAAIKMFIPVSKYDTTNHYPHWFSHELKFAMRKKLRYHRRYKSAKKKNQLWYEKFESERTVTKRLYRRNYKNYTQNVELSLKRNFQCIWKYTEIFLNKNKTAQQITLPWGSEHINNPSDICECFAVFFSCVFNSKPRTSQASTKRDHANELLSIPSLSNGDVSGNDSGAKTFTKSSGTDRIPSFILKGCGDLLAPVLTFILNRSLKDRLPTSCMVSTVVPILKSDSPLSVANYRRILLTLSFAKVFEKAMHCRLMQFFFFLSSKRKSTWLFSIPFCRNEFGHI